MSFINTLIGYPLGWVMYALYFITSNYAVSLFLFTLITRLITLPVIINQQKSSVKMSIIQPELQQLQKQYANNRQKLNEEMMKLYERVGYSPTSGCLPMIIQFVILFGLIDVVYKPLTHILRMPQAVIDAGAAVVEALGLTSARGASMVQLDIISGIHTNFDAFSAAMGDVAANSVLGLNLRSLGMDLTLTPSLGVFKEILSGFNPVILVPLLAGVTSLLASVLSMKSNPAALEGPSAMSMKSMMLTMPLLSVWISFSVPAGVGLYWIYSNVIGIVQSWITHRFFNPRKAAEKAKQEMEERRERERKERIEAKKKKGPDAGLSQKELNRRKLAEARKRAAEKYGEEYVEVEDQDLE